MRATEIRTDGTVTWTEAKDDEGGKEKGICGEPADNRKFQGKFNFK